MRATPNGSQTAARIQHSKTVQYLSVQFFTKQLYQICGESVEAKGRRKKSAPPFLDGLTNSSKLNSTLRTMLKPGTDQNSI